MEISASLGVLLQRFDDSLAYVSDDPVVAGMQGTLLFGAFLLMFLVFFATRDILLRSRSLPVQLMCVLLVALLPVAGFLLYLLLRPARTVRERQMQDRLERMEVFLEEHVQDSPLAVALPALNVAGNSQRRSVQEHAQSPALSFQG